MIWITQYVYGRFLRTDATAAVLPVGQYISSADFGAGLTGGPEPGIVALGSTKRAAGMTLAG